MITAHTLLAVGVVYASIQLEVAKYSAAAIAAYYQFIWRIFYIEYLLLPII